MKWNELSLADIAAYNSKTRGAVQVKSVSPKAVDFFDVTKNGKRAYAGNPKRLNDTLELLPGAHVVDVNRTKRKMTIEAGKKTILWTGELVVEGKPDTAFWYPMQGKDRKLALNPPRLNRPRALFAGSDIVFVQISAIRSAKKLGAAEVKAGRTTVLMF